MFQTSRAFVLGIVSTIIVLGFSGAGSFSVHAEESSIQPDHDCYETGIDGSYGRNSEFQTEQFSYGENSAVEFTLNSGENY